MNDPQPTSDKMTPIEALAFATLLLLGWPILIAFNILVWKVALSL